MVETSLQVIDAFIDGERVDANALKAALAEPAGRDYFVDVWLMREAVHREAAAEATPAIATAVVLPSREPRRWTIAAAVAQRRRSRRGIAAGAAAGGAASAAPSPCTASRMSHTSTK